MFSHFANTAGFWVLLGLPVIIFIHFLQQRSRKLRVSTMFLMDALPPESNTGRVLDRIRSSRSLWLQLLAVLLLTWIMTEPRFVRENSSQTVAIVMDDSAGMRVFQKDARSAALQIIQDYEGKATTTHWVIMGSSPRNETLYRGGETALAREAIAAWMPGGTTHDVSRALKLAADLTDRNGYSWFITDTEAKCPRNQAAIGVGRPLENVGFVGAIFSKKDGLSGWRVAVKNSSRQAQQRSCRVNVDEVEVETRRLDMAPAAVEEFFVPLPEGTGRLVVSLDEDEFVLDDQLPLVRQEPRKLGVYLDLKGRTAEFFVKLLSSMEGVILVDREKAGLIIGGFSENLSDPLSLWKNEQGVQPTPVLAIASAPDRNRLDLKPIVPERLALLDGLSWSGLLSSGAVTQALPAGAEALLWQDSTPLAWREGNSLVINWDWERSNASRLPSFVLLVRRYLESTQDRQPGAFAENLPLNTRLKIVSADRMVLTPVVAGKTKADQVSEKSISPPYQAPSEPGFFQVFLGEREVMKGAAYFDDSRQADFSDCSRFLHELPSAVQERREKLSLPDPLVPLWGIFIIAALIGAWWPVRRRLS